jgi:heme/copper-type cytochrome/quinol oxidase subunit 2
MLKIKNDPKFDYVLLCNKICGGAHYRMKMKVVVVSESDYNQWVATQSKLIEVSTKPEDIQPTSPQAVIIENNDKTLASK